MDVQLVVSTVVSGILFARFSTVESIPTVLSFLLTSLTVEERNESETFRLNWNFFKEL